MGTCQDTVEAIVIFWRSSQTIVVVDSDRPSMRRSLFWTELGTHNVDRPSLSSQPQRFMVG